MARKLVKVQIRMHRSSDLHSLFIVDETDWAWIETWCAKGKEAHFGEVSGKHSDVSVTFGLESFKVISEDQAFIDQFEQVVGDSYGLDIMGHLCTRCEDCGSDMPRGDMEEEFCVHCKERN